MQIIAKDENNLLIPVKEAVKHKNYYCLECCQLIRKRCINSRQEHFYHIKPIAKCRQSTKSLEHLNCQIYFKDLFTNDCILEKRFDAINRIADVYVEKYNLVFEIQVSPLSLAELKQRTCDYKKIGVFVVWILHNKTFNKPFSSLVEKFLKNTTFFYTDMNREGDGVVYDNYFFLKRLKINPLKIFNTPKLKKNEPKILHQRKKYIPIYFEGDITDFFLKNHNPKILKKVKNFEKRSTFSFFYIFYNWLKNIFLMLLEEACR
jgi:competence protein CoiA